MDATCSMPAAACNVDCQAVARDAICQAAACNAACNAACDAICQAVACQAAAWQAANTLFNLSF